MELRQLRPAHTADGMLQGRVDSGWAVFAGLYDTWRMALCPSFPVPGCLACTCVTITFDLINRDRHLPE